MMPVGDDNSQRKTFPYVTYSLIALNVIMFFIELSGGEAFIMDWAFIPSRFLSNPAGEFSTIFSSMFMHAGWAHLFGNMLYLWIFGDNVEDRLGKVKYILFYLFCGIVATFAQMIFNPGSNIPNVGASGAIAGVLGSYIVLFPNTKVNVIVGRGMTQMSALIVIGFWFVLQFLSSFSTLASTEDTGGVAYFAHIGGFLAGLGVTYLIKGTEKV
jgi:membrane associated rhomboid family serine protease